MTLGFICQLSSRAEEFIPINFIPTVHYTLKFIPRPYRASRPAACGEVRSPYSALRPALKGNGCQWWVFTLRRSNSESTHLLRSLCLTLGGTRPTLFSVRPILLKFITRAGAVCNETSFESEERGLGWWEVQTGSRPNSKWKHWIK